MQAQRTTSRAAFGFVFVSAVLSAVSFSIVIPVLPELVRSLSGGNRARAAEWMMLLASAWGLTQFLFSPLLGALADRYGRRPVLLLSSLGLALDFLLMALAPSLTGPLVSRLGSYRALLLGLAVSAASLVWAGLSPNGWWFAASMPLAALGLILGPGLQALLSAEAEPEQQGRLQGATQSLHGLATIIGPPIYGALFAWSLRQDGGIDLSGLVLMLSAAFLAAGLVVSVSAFAPRTTGSRLSAAERP